VASGGQFGPTVYAAWRTSSLGEITEELEHRLLFRLAGPLAGRFVLDVGCGDGTLAGAFAASGAARVIGCDADARMIARANQSHASSGPACLVAPAFLVADATRLPFADASFDIVSIVTVLAFIPDAGAALREIARVLRPGGTLVLGDLGKWNYWAARRRIRAWRGAALWQGATFRTAGQLRALASAAGLRVDHVSGCIFYPPWQALARRMAPWDAVLGERTTLGAAFIAVQARKPAA
jgi:ubiquinone/menaquinone biosynthesis C-methylase UbiE